MDRFGGKVTLSGGASRGISMEIPSLVSMASFKIILQRSHINGGSIVDRSQKVSIPKGARSLGVDRAMLYLLLQSYVFEPRVRVDSEKLDTRCECTVFGEV